MKPFQSLYNWFLQIEKYRKKKVGINISFDDFVEFTKITKCHYCGDYIIWKQFREQGKSMSYNLDRINNSIDYTKENCVVCCWKCNKIKSNLQYNDFVNQIHKIHNNLVE